MRTFVAAVGAVLCCVVFGFAVTSSASATTLVYKNVFGSKSTLQGFKKAGNANCKRAYNSKKKEFRVNIARGRTPCPWFLPVLGDSALPSHQVIYKAKIMKTTKGTNVRKRAYLSSSLRVSGNARYELRVYPRTRRYQLLRFPTSGQFPITGKSNKIKKLGKSNRVMLRAFSARVDVVINGTRLVDVLDDNVGQVEGRRIQVGAGHGTNSKKPVRAAFKEVSVSVPAPR